MEVPLEDEDSTFTNISLADDSAEHLPAVLHPGVEGSHSTMMNADMDAVEAENQVELEEKTRLINQVLELQHTLEDLSARVDAVKEENLKLKSENQVLGQYIENLMSASSVFQTTDTKSKRKYAVKTERTFEKNFGAIERPNNRTLY
ncbi:short coiled-coil protein isoform X6 [Pelodiscus sinensis]|uniref:short coiled-coil protein isoform X6 n=2 Tax=Pelodiscus sinensis TaxID=13735 RepID=UPI003F6BF7D6